MADKNIERGSLVESLAGHDKGKAFVVIATEGDYAFICDGEGRKLESPKRKKIKHLKTLYKSITLDLFFERGGLTDGDLKREIKRNLNKTGG